MKKSNSIGAMVDTLTYIGKEGLWPGSRPITTKNYVDWEKTYCVDILKGWRLGQSFCEYFGVSNASPLYWFKDSQISLKWIQSNYLNNVRQRT